LIYKLGTNYRSILVTSRYDRDDIVSQCEMRNIKLLPKELAGVVSIVIEDVMNNAISVLS
jgi:transcriptional regulator of NAD metabolism